jgi:SAM-dependent methyltransferase
MPDNPGERSSCVVCGSNGFEYLFTKERRDYWRCRSCDLEAIWPLPAPNELVDYYDTAYRDGSYKPFVETDGMLARRARSRLGQVLPYVDPGRWLDVGCSTGEFVSAAINHGFEAMGIELAAPAVARAQQAGRPVFQSSIEAFESPNPFETVTAFDVIEHVTDPRQFLEHVLGLVASGGVLVLTTPNTKSLSRRLMRGRWYFYLPQEHLFLFTRRNLCSLLESAGFDVQVDRGISKHVSMEYAMTQFSDLNPWLFKVFAAVRLVTPRSLRELQIPLRLGEILVVARRRRVAVGEHP